MLVTEHYNLPTGCRHFIWIHYYVMFNFYQQIRILYMIHSHHIQTTQFVKCTEDYYNA